MTDLQGLYRAIDELPPDELEQLRDYIEQRYRKVKWSVVPPENLDEIAKVMRPVRDDAAVMSGDEVNAAIDEALTEVRRERRQNHQRP